MTREEIQEAYMRQLRIDYAYRTLVTAVEQLEAEGVRVIVQIDKAALEG